MFLFSDKFSDLVFEFTESIIWSQLTRKSLFAMDFMLNLINHISYHMITQVTWTTAVLLLFCSFLKAAAVIMNCHCKIAV